jgi:hypothetical protein
MPSPSDDRHDTSPPEKADRALELEESPGGDQPLASTPATRGLRSVPPRSLRDALDHVRRGGRLGVITVWRATIITRKTLEGFQAANAWLLREEGDGYRLRSGRGSIYLFPGQLSYLD